jgi:hypothetical protein
MEPQPESISTPPPPPPPPPPPRKSRTGLWVGIALGVVVLCLCPGIVGVVGWTYRTSIPGISSLFATPTPQGVYYNNSSLGISLYYPNGWVYEEQGSGTIVFATSQEVLNSPDTLTSGAAMGFIIASADQLSLPSDVDTTSPVSILNSFTQSSFSGNSTVLENTRAYTLGSYPAASTVLLIDDGSGSNFDGYMTVVLTNQQIAIVIGITAEGQVQQYRPTFDGMLSSLVLGQ